MLHATLRRLRRAALRICPLLLASAAVAQVPLWEVPNVGAELPKPEFGQRATARGKLYEFYLRELQGEERGLVLRCTDLASQEEVWSLLWPDARVPQALVADPETGDALVLASRSGDSPVESVVRRYSAADGALLAEQSVGLYVSIGVGFQGDRLILTEGASDLFVLVSSGTFSSTHVLALDPQTLAVRWETAVQLGDRQRIAHMAATPGGELVAVGGVVEDFFGNYEFDATWACFDGSSGRELWRERYETVFQDTQFSELLLSALPDGAGGSLFRLHAVENTFGSQLHTRDALTGQNIGIWPYPGSFFFVNRPLYQDPERGLLVHLGGDRTVIEYRSALTGESLGQRPLPPATTGNSIALELETDALFVTATRDNAPTTAESFAALTYDLVTGRLLWSRLTPPAGTPPIPFGGALTSADPAADPYVSVGTQFFANSFFLPLLRTWSADGAPSRTFSTISPLEAPGTPTTLLPTADPSRWCALTLNLREPLFGVGAPLPLDFDESLNQHLNLFDPRTGTLQQRLPIFTGNLNGTFAFDGEGACLGVAEQIPGQPQDSRIEVRAIDVLTAARPWSARLRFNASVPERLGWDLASDRCVALWSGSETIATGGLQGFGVGFSLLDADTGSPLRETLVEWSGAQGAAIDFAEHYGPLFTDGVGSEPERLFVVGGRRTAFSSSADRDLRLAAFRASDGAELWRSQLDVDALSGGLSASVSQVETEPVLGDIWLAGVIDGDLGAGESDRPYLARLSAGNGGVVFLSGPDPDGVEGAPTGTANGSGTVAFVDLSLPDRALLACTARSGPSGLASTWLTAIAKSDGQVLWSRLLDPVTEGLEPLGLCVDPASNRAAAFGRRYDASDPFAPTKTAAAAAWIDTDTGAVLATVEGSAFDGSEFISGAFDGPELLLGSLRNIAGGPSPAAALSRWTAP